MHSSHNPVDMFGLFFHVRLIKVSGLQGDKGSKVESQGISGLLRSVTVCWLLWSWRLAYSVGNHWKPKCWVQSLDIVIHNDCHNVFSLCKVSGQILFVSFWPLCIKGSKSCERLGRVHSTGTGTGPWWFAVFAVSFKPLKMPKQVGAISRYAQCWNILKLHLDTKHHETSVYYAHWYRAVTKSGLHHQARPQTTAASVDERRVV